MVSDYYGVESVSLANKNTGASKGAVTITYHTSRHRSGGFPPHVKQLG